jgi:aspartate/methionine/tyrosine aminotransferase
MTKEQMYRQALEIAANDPGVPARVRAVCQQALDSPDEPKADADEIERLRKERYRLRSALGAIIGLFHDSDHEAKNIARRVLDSTAENR